MPPGYIVRKPGPSVGITATTFSDTAFAPGGIPHCPMNTNVRDACAARAGPPQGPAGLRVSMTRHGGNVKKLFASGLGVGVGVGVAVGAPVGVLVGVGVGGGGVGTVGVALGVGVGVMTGVWLGVLVGVAVGVGVFVGTVGV